MLLLVSDENFNNDMVRGLLRRNPVVLTHDAATMAGFAYDRVRKGLSMPGVIEVADDLPIGQVIEDVLLLAEYSDKHEWEGQVVYLPL